MGGVWTDWLCPSVSVWVGKAQSYIYTHICIHIYTRIYPPCWIYARIALSHLSVLRTLFFFFFLDLKFILYPTMFLPVYSRTPVKCSGQSKIFLGKREERIMITTADTCSFTESLSQPRAKQLGQALESHVPGEVNLCLHRASQSSPHLGHAGGHCRWKRASQLSDPQIFLSTSSSIKPLMGVESALAEVHVTLSSFYGQKTLLSLFPPICYS